jgi:protein-tyrosine phosphatase
MTSSILFVCLGNICRSPLVEAVARRRFADAGLSIEVDSCGTGGWHVGQGADARSIRVAEEGGYSLTHHRVRQLAVDDFRRFDALLAMDDDNLAALRASSPLQYKDRAMLFLDAAGLDGYAPPIVPDPYYENLDAFRHVLRLAEQGVDGLIERLRRVEPLTAPSRSAAR